MYRNLVSNDSEKTNIKYNVGNNNNIINYAKIKTFRNITRRGSKYKLLEGTKTLLLNQDSFNNKKEKEINNKKSDNNLILSSIISSDSYSTPKKIKEKDKNSKKNIKIMSLHKYTENKLPVTTKSKEINAEIDRMVQSNNYYMKFIGNDNFGYKYVRNNPAYQSYDKKNDEEFIQLMGLNDEEKDPFSVIHNKISKINEKIEIKRDNTRYLLFQTAQKKINAKENKDKDKEKNNYKKKELVINHDFIFEKKQQSLSKKKKELIFSLMKKDEFSDFLIMNYLKSNYPNFLKNSENIKKTEKLPKINNNKSPKIKNNKYTKRKIFVIKDSTIISNPRYIPGFIAEIPSIKEMKSYSTQKRILIMKQFYEFAADKLRTHLTFKYIFCKDRTCLIDFLDLPDNQKYIFVSPTSIFQGLSIPLNKNIIQLYLKHFTEQEDDNFYFNDSSEEENYEKDKYIKTKDDVYDIFLIKKKKKKIFKQKLKNAKIHKIKLSSSFTFGINENKYEYINYSDDEKRKNDFHENYYKYYNNKLDFYIQSQNELFDNRIKQLLSQLKTNKDGSVKNLQKFKKYQKSKNELLKCYLTEKHLPKKNLIKAQSQNKPLKGQDIVDAFNLLRTKDSKININKFIKKNSNSHLPFVEKNINKYSSKYNLNRKKTDLEYPSILSYNLPMIVETHPKYSLTDLIKYYTKFKSLVNLWFNMHTNANVVNYGIDFETFHRCTEDICDEEEKLAKKIFNKINSGTSGVLSLEDYVEALTIMNSKDILDQIDFFMKIFNSKDKKCFNYEDILEICKISIKRLIKGKNNEETDNIVLELGHFLAEYIFKICEVDIKDGININTLKDILINDKKNIEYLKLFMCSFGEDKINKEKKEESDMEKYKNKLKFSIEEELKNMK